MNNIEKCNVSAFFDSAVKLSEEIINKDNKSQLEKEFLYNFALMTLNGLLINKSCKDCKPNNIKDIN